MLGSEYNWLISLSRPADGRPKVRIARGGLLTVAVAVFCLACAALRAGAEAPPAALRAVPAVSLAGN